MRLSALSAAFLLLLSLMACKKDNPHQPNPTTTNSDSTVHIDYIYLASSFQVQEDNVSQYELILSSGSTILLDTIEAVNTPLIANIKTPGPLVDMTVITYGRNAPPAYTDMTTDYTILVNKAINPGAWFVLPGSDSLIGMPPAGNSISNDIQGTILYTNVPPLSGQPFYITGTDVSAIGNTLGSGIYNNATTNNQLYSSFFMLPDFYVYLSFPNVARYNLHHMSSTFADNVSLANMDTGISFRVSHPNLYNNTGTVIYGYPDTTNLQQKINVVYYEGSDSNVVYPGRKAFQKYQYSYLFDDNNDADQSTYTDAWADSVNPNPLILDNTYFNLLSATTSNFSVQFTKMSPGYYSTSYTGASFYLNINAPADSTKLQPLNFLTALNSKMLKSVQLTTMTLSDFYFGYQIIQGQPQPVPLAPGASQYESTAHIPPVTQYAKQF